MNLWATLRLSLRALSTHVMRSVLTMLGIIIGVAAVVAMIAIGRGAQDRVADQMKGLGSNIMLVMPGTVTSGGVRLGAQSNQNLTEDDAAAIAREVPEVQAAAPTNRSAAQVVAGNSNWNTSVIGMNNDFLEVRDWPLQSGRLFEPGEVTGSAKVALIGQTVAEKLFGDMDPLDQNLRIKKVPFTVVGVLQSKGQNSFGQDQDDVILIPITTHRNRIQGGTVGKQKRVGSITVKVWEGQSMAFAEEHIRQLLRQRLRVQPEADEPFTVRNLTEILQAQEASGRIMTLLLASVAAVSLVVGGIGIMNIMLVSVTERTREIGLRMAVGAKSKDILRQFLMEAVTLSLLGGLLGVALGALSAWAVGEWTEWQISLSLASILLAVSFSAAVGVFFGYYPARRAAALRSFATRMNSGE